MALEGHCKKEVLYMFPLCCLLYLLPGYLAGTWDTQWNLLPVSFGSILTGRFQVSSTGNLVISQKFQNPSSETIPGSLLVSLSASQLVQQQMYLLPSTGAPNQVSSVPQQVVSCFPTLAWSTSAYSSATK